MSANAEIIAELRRVLNERDEAREQLDLTKRELGRWVDRETKAVRERDEARAKCDSLSKQVSTLSRNCTTHYDHGLQLRRWLDETIDQRDEARAEVGRLREMAHDFEAMREDRDSAYRRGAEAMRKRCAMWVKHNSHEDGLGMGSQRMESALAALPIPEEP